MRRGPALAVVLGFVVGVLLGCGTKAPEASGGGESPPVVPPVTDEKKLEELEKAITAKEKELADLRAQAAVLRDKIAQKNPTKPVLELLAALPKEKWPKDGDDSLRIGQATEWYKNNVVGKRASWVGVKASAIKFGTPSGGRVGLDLDQNSPPLAKLYGGEWRFALRTGDMLSGYHYVRAGLESVSVATAEKLRDWPKDKHLEITFKLEDVSFTRDTSAPLLDIKISDPKLMGVGP